MDNLDDNLTIRGVEPLGIIGNGSGFGIIDKDGGVSIATFLKTENKKWRTLGEKTVFISDFLKIDMEGKIETKQFYVKDTAILVTKMIGVRDAIKIYV